MSHVAYCMNDHSMAFINQSTDTLGKGNLVTFSNIEPNYLFNVFLISAMAAVSATRAEFGAKIAL